MTDGSVAAGSRGTPTGVGLVTTVTVIAALGTAGSWAVGAGMWWLWTGRLALDWWAVPADAIAYLLLALWCVRLVERRRCATDRRAYRAIVIGLAAATISGMVYWGFLAALVGGVGSAAALLSVLPQVLVIKLLGGTLIWAIVYAGLVLRRLCRTRGHVHGEWAVGHTVERPADLPRAGVRVRADPSKES